MSRDTTGNAAGSDSATSEPETEMIEEIEQGVLNRRSFLAGLVAGGTAAGGVGYGVSQLLAEDDSQSLATLASGETGDATSTTYHLPAVLGVDDGAIITTDISFGTDDGLYVNLDGIEVRHDVQAGLREATVAAQEYAEANPPSDGLLVTFSSPNDGFLTLEGKSWEAGLTVALVAAISGRKPDRETLVTGIVNDDGKLLPIGGVEAKAEAAREFGATRLLVPAGQATQIPGITIEEVRTIDAALETILSESERQ